MYQKCTISKKYYFCCVDIDNKRKNKIMKDSRKEKRLARKAAARKRMIDHEAYLDYIKEYGKR